MTGRSRRPAGPPPVPVAVAVGAMQLLGCLGAARASHTTLSAPAVVLLLVGPVAIGTLHRRRLVPLALAIVAAVTYVALDYPIGPVFLAPVAALWLEFIRGNRERWAAARRESELSREQRATQERVAVARELHDVIGHSLSLINVQAGVALHLLDSHPEHARPALATIKSVSHDALEEVRLVLDALRDPAGAPARAPAPSLTDIPALVAQSGAGGTAWSLEVSGPRGHVPAAVDAAAYRVVQEAMTNVRRHAHAAHATVTIRYAEGRVRVSVTDDGRGAPSGATEGAGLTGMRERVGALGGTFRAGPGPTGYAVDAELTWQGREEAP